MHRIPRDISANLLIIKLQMYDYQIVRKKGSHIRLKSDIMGKTHYITIPDKISIKVGTLNSILKDISIYLKISKEELIQSLFDK